MANENQELAITLPAEADYSTTGQYLFVNIHTTGNAILVASQGAAAVGVLSNNPNIGQAARVVYGGRTKVMSGETTIAAGSKLTTGADGRAETAASGDHVVAVAITGGADGTIIDALLVNSHILA